MRKVGTDSRVVQPGTTQIPSTDRFGMGRDVSLGWLDAEESTNTNLLSLYVSEAPQDVLSQRGFNSLRHFGVFPDWFRQDIVVGETVLDLLHQSDGSQSTI